jgi:hypothetical protein
MFPHLVLLIVLRCLMYVWVKVGLSYYTALDGLRFRVRLRYVSSCNVNSDVGGGGDPQITRLFDFLISTRARRMSCCQNIVSAVTVLKCSAIV